MCAQFRNGLYGLTHSPILSPDNFKRLTLLMVIDVSKQDWFITATVIDCRIEFTTHGNIPANITPAETRPSNSVVNTADFSRNLTVYSSSRIASFKVRECADYITSGGLPMCASKLLVHLTRLAVHACSQKCCLGLPVSACMHGPAPSEKSQDVKPCCSLEMLAVVSVGRVSRAKSSSSNYRNCFTFMMRKDDHYGGLWRTKPHSSVHLVPSSTGCGKTRTRLLCGLKYGGQLQFLRLFANCPADCFLIATVVRSFHDLTLFRGLLVCSGKNLCKGLPTNDAGHGSMVVEIEGRPSYSQFIFVVWEHSEKTKIMVRSRRKHAIGRREVWTEPRGPAKIQSGVWQRAAWPEVQVTMAQPEKADGLATACSYATAMPTARNIVYPYNKTNFMATSTAISFSRKHRLPVSEGKAIPFHSFPYITIFPSTYSFPYRRGLQPHLIPTARKQTRTLRTQTTVPHAVTRAEGLRGVEYESYHIQLTTEQDGSKNRVPSDTQSPSTSRGANLQNSDSRRAGNVAVGGDAKRHASAKLGVSPLSICRCDAPAGHMPTSSPGVVLPTPLTTATQLHPQAQRQWYFTATCIRRWDQ
ncbi:hypothetical protein PR048_012699 [Dryococelus australis]|uniref:Double jelly roll-like domain-containing protein n=1 Tax=Dryococelus australis TaxID=614101 RepID=A0ABQ9HQ44_9NEOP|nr:hypothetical protein PR048_012699 [Dryococelus australis]